MERSPSDSPDERTIEIEGLPSFTQLPPVEPVREGGGSQAWLAPPRFHAASRPASALTGDFYLSLRRGESWLVGLGDVAGHGLEASIYMMMIQEEIERLAERDDLDLTALVGALHATLRRELPGSRFASLVLAELGPGGRMEVVNAGHPPPLVRRGSGEILALPSNGPILGPLPQSRWSSLTTRLRRHDTLLLVSDGVLEACSPAGEEFGGERLWRLLERLGSLEPRAVVEGVFDEVARFRAGTDALDDTTVVAIKG
jgi:serine phosphatase RsbU (regulator of sigma subunit)